MAYLVAQYFLPCIQQRNKKAPGLRISLAFAVIKNLSRPDLWMTKVLQALWISVLAVTPKPLFCLVHEHHVCHVMLMAPWEPGNMERDLAVLIRLLCAK